MTFSVLQWNIWYKEDIRNIGKFLESHKADIICLQELSLNHPLQTIKDTPAYIAEQLGYNYYHKELPIESTEGEPITLANGIFSRFPITSKRFTWINQPEQSGGPEDEYRAYVEVLIDVEGKEARAGTTHMSYTHRFESTANKQRETDVLVAELKKSATPLIFTGDLNALPGSYTIESVESILKHAGPSMDQKSWATKPFSYNGFEEDKLNWRLDYVFASKDLKIESSKILQTEYSDHLPILTKVSL